MSAEPFVLTIPAEIRTPLDATCFVLPDRAAEVRIDMSGVEWIAPVGVVALLAQCLRGDEQRTKIEVVLPENREVRSYLGAIGFYQALRDNEVPVEESALDIVSDYSVRPCLPPRKIEHEIEVESARNDLGDALGTSHAPITCSLRWTSLSRRSRVMDMSMAHRAI